MLRQRWHLVEIFVAYLAPPKPYTTTLHLWCTLRWGELGQSKQEDVGGVRTDVWQLFNTAGEVLATLCSTWKCLPSTWGWNVASKRCCSFTGKDIVDRVKDNTSTVARRPYLATSQASRVLEFDSGAFSAGKAIKLAKSCCKELSLATSCLRSSTENDFRTRFLLVIIKRTFLELAWRRPEHLIVSEAPNNKTANCFHELFCLNKVSH